MTDELNTPRRMRSLTGEPGEAEIIPSTSQDHPLRTGPEGVRSPSVWLLGLASGLSPFGVTMAIPVVAAIASHFQADYATVQFVISAYMLGLALAQPFNGYLCDRFGRRPVMLTGFTIFVSASAGCIWVESLWGLIALRFLQAAGVSVGTVVSRAVVRDTRGPRETAVALGYIAAVMGFAPIVAPILGAWLGTIGSFRTVFSASTLMGFLVLVVIYRTLPETLDRSHSVPRMGALLGNYRTLLTSRLFLGYSMLFGFVQGSFFAFMTVGAAVFETDLGLGARGFGTAWSLMAVTYIIGAVGAARLTRTAGPGRVTAFAVAITLFAGWLMALLTATSGPTPMGILLPMTLMMFSAGGVIPGALAGVVNAYPRLSGTASGLSNALGMLFGGVFAVLAGALYDGVFAPVAWLVAASTTLTAISWLLTRQRRSPRSAD